MVGYQSLLLSWHSRSMATNNIHLTFLFLAGISLSAIRIRLNQVTGKFAARLPRKPPYTDVQLLLRSQAAFQCRQCGFSDQQQGSGAS